MPSSSSSAAYHVESMTRYIIKEHGASPASCPAPKDLTKQKGDSQKDSIASSQGIGFSASSGQFTEWTKFLKPAACLPLQKRHVFLLFPNGSMRQTKGAIKWWLPHHAHPCRHFGRMPSHCHCRPQNESLASEAATGRPRATASGRQARTGAPPTTLAQPEKVQYSAAARVARRASGQDCFNDNFTRQPPATPGASSARARGPYGGAYRSGLRGGWGRSRAGTMVK